MLTGRLSCYALLCETRIGRKLGQDERSYTCYYAVSLCFPLRTEVVAVLCIFIVVKKWRWLPKLPQSVVYLATVRGTNCHRLPQIQTKIHLRLSLYSTCWPTNMQMDEKAQKPGVLCSYWASTMLFAGVQKVDNRVQTNSFKQAERCLWPTVTIAGYGNFRNSEEILPRDFSCLDYAISGSLYPPMPWPT